MVVGTVAEVWRYPFKSMRGERLERAAVGADGLAGDRGWAVRDEAAAEIRGAKKLPALLACRARYVSEPAGGGSVPPVVITLPDGASCRSDEPGAAQALSRFLGREVTLWPRQPPQAADHYRRGIPDNPDMEAELRGLFGRLPDEPLPDLSVFPPELFEYTSPLGTYFDAFPLHLLTTAWLGALAARNPGARFDVRRFRPNVLIRTAAGTASPVELDWCGRTLRVGGIRVRVEVPCARCVMTTHAQEDLPKDPSVLRTIVRDTGQNAGVYATVAEPGAVAVGDEVVLEAA